MKIIKVNDYHEMSSTAANIIFQGIIQSANIVLGLPTGGTPIGFYNKLVKKINEDNVSCNHIHTFNLDEYVGLAENDPNSYHAYMKENFYNHVSIPREHTHIPRGNADDLQKECVRYEQLISSIGGIDIQLLGIGGNGHIGFNEPGTSFESKTHVVDLTPSTLAANARYFPSEESVPKQAITMGIQTIMKSKQIVLLASGEAKAEALYKLVNGPIHEGNPVSILKKHPNVTIIADEVALKYVDKKVNFG